MDVRSQPSKQQLASLGRKHLLVVPQRVTGSSISSTFLERIERIEINETRVHDGVTFYVLDVFLYHVNSRHPTNATNHRSLVGSTSPDFQIERRFSEFVKLRNQVSDATLLKLDCVCAYCAEFSMFLSFSMHQPRALTTLTVVSTEKRKKMLVSFLNDFVRLGKSKELQNDSCKTHEPVPHLIREFMRKNVEVGGPIARDPLSSSLS